MRVVCPDDVEIDVTDLVPRDGGRATLTVRRRDGETDRQLAMGGIRLTSIFERAQVVDQIINRVGTFDVDAQYWTDLIETACSLVRRQLASVQVGTNGTTTTSAHRQVHTADEAFDAPEEIRWLVDGLITRPSTVALVGEAGSKKTYTAFDLGVCVASGQRWLGRAVTQGPVFIIDEESGRRRLKHRLAQAIKGHGYGRGLPIYWTSLGGYKLNDPLDVEEIRTCLVEVRPALIIIDALIEVSGGADENSSTEMNPVLDALRQIAAEIDAAVLVIHHGNKAGGYRGSSAIKGGVDLMLMIESKPDSVDLDFKTEKARDIAPVTFAASMRRDDLRDSVCLVPTGLTPTHILATIRSRNERYVLEYLRDHGASDVQAITGHADPQDGYSPGAARKAVYTLMDRGLVARVDQGGSGAKGRYDLTTSTRLSL
jgi:hypothetical protein